MTLDTTMEYLGNISQSKGISDEARKACKIALDIVDNRKAEYRDEIEKEFNDELTETVDEIYEKIMGFYSVESGEITPDQEFEKSRHIEGLASILSEVMVQNLGFGW